jgi:hypothetical protein
MVWAPAFGDENLAHIHRSDGINLKTLAAYCHCPLPLPQEVFMKLEFQGRNQRVDSRAEFFWEERLFHHR